ncbi:SRC kinase signaling inhibitor 1 SNAP-25-interacting protein [Collichthys lucidus]|uniref:SRC kinase signaling inhibitor 1 SNAP-25-interacting protein n=1 Tax=Collichthys lucidus TaxID=240159 RepID=A0A4U5VVY2_COLLU|nr:SRC kinase signaling inhibitor 1 SNAP-25-interacting protein [Collichthys lucidus]
MGCQGDSPPLKMDSKISNLQTRVSENMYTKVTLGVEGLRESLDRWTRVDPERGGSHMISTDDLEYPREYRTLGNSARRFSNVGLVHTSEHRHTVSAAQSLEALTNLHKADMERKRDAFMDHLKSKYQQQQQLQHPHHSPHHNPPSPSPSHA